MSYFFHYRTTNQIVEFKTQAHEGTQALDEDAVEAAIINMNDLVTTLPLIASIGA